MRLPNPTRFRTAALAFAIGIASPLAFGAGWGALFAKGPVVDFQDEDLRMYLDAIKRALEAAGDPQPVQWQNPASGAGGTIVVLGRPAVKDFADCRRVRSTVHSKKQKDQSSTWTACKEPGGRWVLVSAG